ncbi:hypothetical protein [Azospirillum sp.]|uniref:hypothetical protein n=1 Tax=Azospirillum sp. TaxID=34012 RepID=UPI003D75CA75
MRRITGAGWLVAGVVVALLGSVVVAVGAPGERVAIVRSAPGAAPSRPVTLEAADWEAFLAASRTTRAEAARSARDAATARVKATVAEAVAAMRADIPAFLAWRFSFFTTYRLTFSALAGAFTGTSPAESVGAVTAERFRALVLNPDALRTRLSAAMDAVAADTIARRAALTVERAAALDRMAAERGLSAGSGSVMAAVSEADALGLPTPDPLRPQVPIPDPSGEVGWLGGREALVMAGRQAARRGTGLAAEPALMASLPVALLEGAPLLAAPVVGVVATGVGMAVEYLAVRLWESEERDDLVKAANEALDLYAVLLVSGLQPMADDVVLRTLGPWE